MKIPGLDLKKQYAPIKKEIMSSIAHICDEQSFVLGKPVEQFENEVAEYCGTKYAIGCASGTDAILLSLKVAGIGKDDEVLVPSFTFIASAEPIVRVGAKPVFCDIDEHTYNIDPAEIENKITKKTKAIIVVHLYGQIAHMKPINKIARKYKLIVIEDACQAIGSIYGTNGKKAGNLGDLGCFSFFPSKNLGGFGDGGIITTNIKSYRDQLMMLRQHGSKVRYHNDILGMNSRLDAIQAAVLHVKLKYLDGWLEQRNKKAVYYNKIFAKKQNGMLLVPMTENNNYHTYHQYVIQLLHVTRKKRDQLLTYLQQQGIGANIYYPIPCHLQKCFSFLNVKKGSLPITEKLMHTVLALPIYPELKSKEQEYIVNAIVTYLNRKK